MIRLGWVYDKRIKFDTKWVTTIFQPSLASTLVSYIYILIISVSFTTDGFWDIQVEISMKQQSRFNYHLVICYIAMERSTIFQFGKPSISMGHLYHGYVSHNQRVTKNRCLESHSGVLENHHGPPPTVPPVVQAGFPWVARTRRGIRSPFLLRLSQHFHNGTGMHKYRGYIK